MKMIVGLRAHLWVRFLALEVRYALMNTVVFAAGGKEMSRHASYEDILQSFYTTELDSAVF
jgi:hypothetical protein